MSIRSTALASLLGFVAALLNPSIAHPQSRTPSTPTLLPACSPPSNVPGDVCKTPDRFRQPLRFEENAGQAPHKVKFFARSGDLRLALMQQSLLLQTKDASGDRIATEIAFLNANPETRVEGLEPQRSITNYFDGNDSTKWVTRVRSYARVRYKEIYPGIDLVFYENEDHLDYDFVVSPGADPRRIVFTVESEKPCRLDADGNLAISGDDSSLRLGRPLMYQTKANAKTVLLGGLAPGPNNTWHFEVPAYDETRPLIIDPPLLYLTYLGGGSDDTVAAMALDAAGNSYLVGTTVSLDFPVTGNAFQTAVPGLADLLSTAVFVTKFDPTGSVLYSTFVGSSLASGTAIAVDSIGDAFVGGQASPSVIVPNFPTTPNAYQASSSNGGGFVFELSPDGSNLLYSTMFGNGGAGCFVQVFCAGTVIQQIALDAAGGVYFGGYTTAPVPTTPGSYISSFSKNSVENGFLAKLDLSKSGSDQLVYGTYLAGTSFAETQIQNLTVDASGVAYTVGWTSDRSFPTTSNAQISRLCSGCTMGFLTEFSADGTHLLYSSFVGGTTSTTGFAPQTFTNRIRLGSDGSIYIGGISNTSDLPTMNPLSVAVGPTKSTQNCIFVTKVSNDGTKLLYSTYVGPRGFVGNPSGPPLFYDTDGLALDQQGNIYLAGFSGTPGFPTTPDALMPTSSGTTTKLVVAEISADGSKLLYGTYLGGNGNELGAAIGVDTFGSIHLAGNTTSTNLPVTSNALQSTFANGDVNPTGNDVLFAILGREAISSLVPTVGGNTGDVTITITGAGFQSGATCSIVLGSSVIQATQAVVASNGTSLVCTFGLTGAITGAYNLVVNNPDGTSFTKMGGFTVQNGGQPNLSVQVVGRAIIRTGSPATFYVNITNTGNQDAYFVPLWVTLPAGIPFTLAGYGPTHFASIGGATNYAGLIVSNVAPRQTFAVPLQITSPANSPGILLTATLQSPWFRTRDQAINATASGSYSTACVPDPLNSYFSNCLGPYLAYGFAGQVPLAPLGGSTAPPAAPPPDPFCPIPASFRNGYNAGVSDCSSGKPHQLPHPVITSGDDLLENNGYNFGFATCQLQRLNGLLSPSPQSTTGSALPPGTCPGPPPPPPPFIPPTSTVTPPSGSSFDPNDKGGPTGDASASHHTKGAAPLSYVVAFENEPTALLPAAQVVITDQLDRTKVDLSTVKLGTIAFGSNVINPPSATNDFNTTYNLSASLSVRIQASLDPATALLKWTLTSIDSTTHLPPTDPTVGFLPPDKDGVSGQGSVLFTVIPKSGLSTGTAITNQATVVFDTNAPIATPIWLNTIDNSPPVSHVLALPKIETSNSFLVQWVGTDVGSGIQGFTIYVSDDGGPFTVWLNDTTSTSTTLAGQSGHTYGFYSIAQDKAGNVEAPKTTADATTEVESVSTCATNVTSQVSIARSGFGYNFATGRFSQTVTLTNSSIKAITGPISLVLDSLSSDAALFNALGKTACAAPLGSPYITTSAASLSAGTSVSVVLLFSDPTKAGITYTARVLAGSGAQ